ncbi:MAG: peptidase [Pedosphaera sp.]|nr:peptidase [Pedosphaera sp.]
MKKRIILGLVCVFALAAQAVDPRLSVITPPGIQIGTESELVFSGSRLADIQEVLFYRPGITVIKIEEAKDTVVRVKVKVETTCRLGEQLVRVRTASGLSDLRTFYVSPFPIVAKVVPKVGEPFQSLALNSTVSGSVANETIDRYIVTAKKGQRLSAEVEAMRLGRNFADPYVAIKDAAGNALAKSDDTSLLVQDAFASAVAPADGDYTIEVRESSYGTLSLYRLHVGTFPRPAVAYPAGGPVGESVEMKLIGVAGGDFLQTFKMPDLSSSISGVFAEQGGIVAPSWNVVRPSLFPNVLETEPNNSLTNATATKVELPLALNGILSEKGDEDCFRFTAKAGQTLDIRVHARSVRSPVDAVLVLSNTNGQTIASNDDSGGPDSYIRFGVPANGDYLLHVRDHLRNGGPEYVYRIEIAPVKPALSLSVPDTARYDTQTRKMIVVPKGNRFGLIVNARRGDFDGDLGLEIADFPPGVAMSADKLAAGLTTHTLVFEARADAIIGGKQGNIIAKQLNPAVGQAPVSGGVQQMFELVIRGNDGTYHKTSVDGIAVAVVEEVPFSIRVEEPKMPLVRSGSMQLKVIADRKPGFTEAITLSMLVNPPGVGSESAVTIPAGQNSIGYTVYANGGAPIQENKFAILGQATVNGGTAYVSTQLATLKVADVFFNGSAPLAKSIVGEPMKVVCTLAPGLPFAGSAKLQLLGLPPGTATTEKMITKDDKTVTFDVTTAPDTRTGLYRSIFCQLIVTENGETVTQSFAGGTSIRVDPIPKPPEAAKPATAPTIPQPPGRKKKK